MQDKIKKLEMNINEKKRQLEKSKDLFERQLIREELRDLQLIYTLINYAEGVMKITILEGGNKLCYENKDKYIIKTALGNFTDVNEAINKVPVIKKSKNIKKCVWCGRYFINVGSGSNNRKTCSKECFLEHCRNRNRNNYYKKKILTYNQNACILTEHIKNKGKFPSGFKQIDNPDKLGEIMLWDRIPKKNGEYDWKKEDKIVKKLKRALYKDNFINP